LKTNERDVNPYFSQSFFIRMNSFLNSYCLKGFYDICRNRFIIKDTVWYASSISALSNAIGKDHSFIIHPSGIGTFIYSNL